MLNWLIEEKVPYLNKCSYFLGLILPLFCENVSFVDYFEDVSKIS